MGALWTYYRVVLKGSGGAYLLRSTAQSRARIFGIQVDEHGDTIISESGGPQIQAFDRAGVQEMTPLVLLGGRLVSAQPKTTDAPRE